MIILLNKHSNGTCGLKKWAALRPDLESGYLGDGYTLVPDFEEFRQRVVRDYDRGERVFVAAGGDGTVNFLLNQLMQIEESDRSSLILGAIALGSSNDFHKPFSSNGNGQTKGEVPVRLDHSCAVPHNVGSIEYRDIDNRPRHRHFIVNCSVGLVAQANYFFNSDNRIVNWMKSRWVEGTIWYSALQTLITARNVPARIRVERDNFETRLTTMSVFINPNVSGSFRYDLEISARSDYLGVGLCERMGIPSRVRTIASLAGGRFAGLPKTRTWRAREIEISPSAPMALEMDGEVTLARHVKIKLMHEALRVCQ